MNLNEMKQTAVDILTESKLLSNEDVQKVTVSTRHLKVSLTDKEIISAADDLTQKLSAIDSVENELESIKSQFKSKIKELEGQAERLRAVVRDKYEIRKVDCVEIMNNTTGMVAEVRIDTGEIINQRAMTADERQARLWNEDESSQDTDTEENEE